MDKKIGRYLFGFAILSSAAIILAVAVNVMFYASVKCACGNNIKISVIVPVYNTEKYVGECLDSIHNQTLKEIEIICVNDGSTDNSLQILEEHQQKDSRIKIINQKNAGVSVARNQGIKNAQGEYIAFVDSDDLIPVYAYEKAYNDAVKYDVDVVDFSVMFFKNGEEMNFDQFRYDESTVKRLGIQSYQNPFCDMLQNAGYVVTKVFKRSFITDNNLLFKEGLTYYEDSLFNLLAFAHVRQMVRDDNFIYCYRTHRPNSAITNFTLKKSVESSIKIAEELIGHRDVFNFKKADDWIINRIMHFNYSGIVEDIKDPAERKYFASKLMELLEENYIKKFNIAVSEEIQSKINNLKLIAEG